jgi:hypothetical protein
MFKLLAVLQLLFKLLATHNRGIHRELGKTPLLLGKPLWYRKWQQILIELLWPWPSITECPDVILRRTRSYLCNVQNAMAFKNLQFAKEFSFLYRS